MFKIKSSLLVFVLVCSICNFIYTQNNYNFHYEVIKIDSSFDERADLTLETYMSQLKQKKDKSMAQIIGTSKDALISYPPMSPLSNLLVDMLFEWGNNYLISKKMKPSDLALLNFGGIRAFLPQGQITVGDIFQIAPFDNSVAFVYVKGSELKKMFDGFTEKKNAPLANAQATYSEGKLRSYTIAGAPLENNKIYTLVTIDFLARGGDDFLRDINYESTLYLGMPVRDVFMNEIRKKTSQNIEIEGINDNRVIILPAP